jgi:hypothetical protein
MSICHFYKFYNTDYVVRFFIDLSRKYDRAIVRQFILYHSEEVLMTWRDLFPRPDLRDLWWRWSLLPPHMRILYTKIQLQPWDRPLL